MRFPSYRRLSIALVLGALFAGAAVMPVAAQEATYPTRNGPKTEAVLHAELTLAGYLGPWDMASMLTAYDEAAPPPAPPAASTPKPQEPCLDFDQTLRAYQAQAPYRVGPRAAEVANQVAGGKPLSQVDLSDAAFYKSPDLTKMVQEGRFCPPSFPSSLPAPPVLVERQATSRAMTPLGTVVLKGRGCDYFVVEASNGDYAVLEWFGGHDPFQGDQLTGDWTHYGFTDVMDLNAGSSVHVYVDDYSLSRARALEVLSRHCH
jgi:hypothetical protein